MKRSKKAIRAFAVWHDTPGRWIHEWDGTSFYVREPASFAWLDESFQLHSRPLAPGEKLPRFKLIRTPRGVQLELGHRQGEFSIVHRGTA